MPMTRIVGRWALTEDRKRVVPEDDLEARWLHWIDGDEVDEDEARRLGATTKVYDPRANHKLRRPGNNK